LDSRTRLLHRLCASWSIPCYSFGTATNYPL
jgi:hypothetical protein